MFFSFKMDPIQVTALDVIATGVAVHEDTEAAPEPTGHNVVPPGVAPGFPELGPPPSLNPRTAAEDIARAQAV